MSSKPIKYIVAVEFIPNSALEKYVDFIQAEDSINDYKTELVLLHDRSTLGPKNKSKLKLFNHVIKVDFNDSDNLQSSLLPFQGRILGVVCRSEGYIPKLANLVAHVPYAHLPTKESLLWSVNKLKMRRRFKAHNSRITPKFREVKELSEAELDKIEKVLDYPMIVKPFGLAQSLLVSNVYHRDELRKVLKKSFNQLSKIYKKTEKVGPQGLLVEEIMDGSQYSIDCFVNSKGKIYFCPPVHIKTGKQIGFDDYFGYRQMTPTKLSAKSIAKAEAAVSESVHALGLRSTTAHVELIRTESNWKVVEVGPRVGGFREELYERSYGIDVSINDLLIRMGRKPVIAKKVQGYSAALKMYAKKEGVIKSVKGIKSVTQLNSFVKFIGKPLKAGDKAMFAKHGGSSVAKIILHNDKRSDLLADIRRLEQMFEVKIK